jgi:hypothetical protein
MPCLHRFGHDARLAGRSEAVQQDFDHCPYLVKDEAMVEPMMLAPGTSLYRLDLLRQDLQKQCCVGSAEPLLDKLVRSERLPEP